MRRHSSNLQMLSPQEPTYFDKPTPGFLQAPCKEDPLIDDEADAAAGGTTSVLKRVSSFSIMSRVSSSSVIPSLLETASKGGGEQQQEEATAEEDSSINIPSWRLRDRMKTVGVGLVMALNVGTDPPDIIKPHPCAKLQCWMDPSSVTRAKAKEKIGERLEAQYAKWQQQRAARSLKYRRALDPTVEDVRALCLWHPRFPRLH